MRPPRRPTVLHCVRDFVRPSESFVADVVRRCDRTRPVVACANRPVDGAHLVPSGVRVHRVGRWVSDDARPAGRRAVRALLLAVAAAERARLLHAHFGYWAAHTARTAVRLDRPWVLSLHGHDLLVEHRSDPEAPVVRGADAVVVPSRFLADAAVAAGFPADRVRIIPSGIDLSRFPFRERQRGDGLTVTFAGRFVAKKGVLDAVDALASVHRERPDLRAVLVGFGPLEADVRRRAASAGLPVEIRSGAEPDAVRRALEETDLLLMPSRTAPDGDAESLGLVAVEAQACGVPVVATRHGGLVDVVHPEAGHLVPEGDVAALAAAVLELGADPGRWPALGRAGRAHVERSFDLGRQVAELERLQLEILSARHES
jgi:colanic acid/amylovoran biosynthesis glycosyltransferase